MERQLNKIKPHDVYVCVYVFVEQLYKKIILIVAEFS